MSHEAQTQLTEGPPLAGCLQSSSGDVCVCVCVCVCACVRAHFIQAHPLIILIRWIACNDSHMLQHIHTGQAHEAGGTEGTRSTCTTEIPSPASPSHPPPPTRPAAPRQIHPSLSRCPHGCARVGCGARQNSWLPHLLVPLTRRLKELKVMTGMHTYFILCRCF